jgi:hypothetical protein
MDTLHALYTLWSRPVYIETYVHGKGQMVYGYGPDGINQREMDKK